MVAKIELKNHDKVCRFWVYDGAFARQLTNFDVPYNSFSKTDYNFESAVCEIFIFFHFFIVLMFVVLIG